MEVFDLHPLLQVALLLGMIVMAAIAFGLGCLLVAVGHAFAKACSLTRFYLSVGKLNDIKLSPMKLPKYFLLSWLRFMVADSRIQGQGGHWHGIGNWKAYKAGEKA